MSRVFGPEPMIASECSDAARQLRSKAAGRGCADAGCGGTHKDRRDAVVNCCSKCKESRCRCVLFAVLWLRRKMRRERLLWGEGGWRALFSQDADDGERSSTEQCSLRKSRRGEGGGWKGEGGKRSGAERAEKGREGQGHLLKRAEARILDSTFHVRRSVDYQIGRSRRRTRMGGQGGQDMRWRQVPCTKYVASDTDSEAASLAPPGPGLSRFPSGPFPPSPRAALGPTHGSSWRRESPRQPACLGLARGHEPVAERRASYSVRSTS